MFVYRIAFAGKLAKSILLYGTTLVFLLAHIHVLISLMTTQKQWRLLWQRRDHETISNDDGAVPDLGGGGLLRVHCERGHGRDGVRLVLLPPLGIQQTLAHRRSQPL